MAIPSFRYLALHKKIRARGNKREGTKPTSPRRNTRGFHMSYRSKSKASLLLGTSFIVLTALTAPALAQQVAQSDTEAVIVTGTRVTGMTAADSAAPITVIGSDALSHVGQPNLIQALAQIAPSFTAEALGGDTAALTLSARLRGISPNDTLVLINGKRRHSTGNLHVLGGAFQGAATTDLDLIPTNAIDHIEVLQDGAAAQYGTDAIAGVVNIILKSAPSGGRSEERRVGKECRSRWSP